MVMISVLRLVAIPIKVRLLLNELVKSLLVLLGSNSYKGKIVIEINRNGFTLTLGSNSYKGKIVILTFSKRLALQLVAIPIKVRLLFQNKL